MRSIPVPTSGAPDVGATRAAAQADIAADVASVARVEFIPTVLALIQEHTGLRWSAVARVDAASWTACAVRDQQGVNLGLVQGSQIPIETTLCVEVMRARTPIAISEAAHDPLYAQHICTRSYGFQSYVSAPIVLPSGDYFGNLCGLDPLPRAVADERTLSMFRAYAALIAAYLETERQRDAAQAALLARMRKAGSGARS